MKHFVALLFFVMMFISSSVTAQADGSFYDKQLSFTRVREAVIRRQPWIESQKQKLGLFTEHTDVFFRVFKKEQVLEVWIKKEYQFVLLQCYPICYFSGELGPKRKEGDMQVPEGLYHISVFNADSKFHLSLGLNYPNESDLLLSDAFSPGSDIYIHGDCVSTGCLAMTDDLMEEIYVIALHAASAGQSHIPVHIFPFRFSEEKLQQKNFPKPLHKFFPLWHSLRLAYTFFEENKKIPLFTVDEKGIYQLNN